MLGLVVTSVTWLPPPRTRRTGPPTWRGRDDYAKRRATRPTDKTVPQSALCRERCSKRVGRGVAGRVQRLAKRGVAGTVRRRVGVLLREPRHAVTGLSHGVGQLAHADGASVVQHRGLAARKVDLDLVDARVARK